MFQWLVNIRKAKAKAKDFSLPFSFCSKKTMHKILLEIVLFCVGGVLACVVIRNCPLRPDTPVLGLLNGDLLRLLVTFLLVMFLAHLLRDLLALLYIISLVSVLVFTHLVVLHVTHTRRLLLTHVVVLGLVPQMFVEGVLLAFLHLIDERLPDRSIVTFLFWDIFTRFLGNSLTHGNGFLGTFLLWNFLADIFWMMLTFLLRLLLAVFTMIGGFADLLIAGGTLLLVLSLTLFCVDSVALLPLIVMTVQDIACVALSLVHSHASLLCRVLADLDWKFSTLMFT